MQGQVILVFGIAFVGAAIGYMVGGSASPVVSVVIPVIFGLVATAIGLMQASKPNKEVFELLKIYGDKADSIPEVMDHRNRVRTAPRRIGVSLVVFSVTFIAAATFGAKVRIDKLLVSKVHAPQYPWSSNQVKPPNISAALDWIALQRRLLDLGYGESQIATLYDLQVQDWNSRAATTQLAPCQDRSESQPSSNQKENNSPLTIPLDLQKWFKQSEGANSPPFANQPPETIMNRLKDMGIPENAIRGSYSG